MELNEKELNDFRCDVRNAMYELCKKYQVKLTGIDLKYRSTDFEMKLSFDKADVDTERIKFENDCEYYGFKKSDYKWRFEQGNDQYEFIGFKPRAKKYRCIARNLSNGQLVVYSDEDMKLLMNGPVRVTVSMDELDKNSLVSKDQLDFLKMKLGKSKRNEKDWVEIGKVLAEKFLFTFTLEEESFMVTAVDSIGVESGSGMLFFEKKEMEAHLDDLVDMGVKISSFTVHALPYEEYIRLADKYNLPLNILISADKKKPCLTYFPDRKKMDIQYLG